MARQSAPDGNRNRGGRPRLIDAPSRVEPQITNADLILQYVRAGAPLVLAARSAGIGDTTMEEWRRRGRGTDRRDDPDGRFARFASDVQQAEAESALRLVVELRQMAIGDPYTVTRTVTKHVRDENGQIVPVTETTETRGVKRYPRTVEWLLQRRAPEWFGTQPLVSANDVVDDETTDEVAEALGREWAAYELGRGDAARARANGSDSPGAEAVPEGG